MRTAIIILLASFLSFTLKGQDCDCDFEAYKKELVELGGTYLKDFQVKPTKDQKNWEFRFTLVLSRNTKYLFSCKANGIITFLLSSDITSIPGLTIKSDNSGKPVYFEYIPEKTGAYHLTISGVSKNICALAIVSFLETIKPYETVDTSKVYEVVDEPASFENGDINIFKNYVLRNFKIDKSLKNFQGKMFIDFNVDRNGVIENIELLRSCGKKDLDIQALKIIKAAPKWKPAKINGVNVKQRFRMVLQINL